MGLTLKAKQSALHGMGSALLKGTTLASLKRQFLCLIVKEETMYTMAREEPQLHSIQVHVDSPTPHLLVPIWVLRQMNVGSRITLIVLLISAPSKMRSMNIV